MKAEPVVSAGEFWAYIGFISDPDSFEWGVPEIEAIEEFHGVDVR